jgi:single-stranded-DNA-specific exonuclease
MMPIAQSALSLRRSLAGRPWVDPVQDYRDTVLRALCERLNISESLGRILAFRKLMDEETAQRFLHPDEAQFHAPELMLGMPEAVLRLARAIEQYEKILIFGDYDVDGTSAAAILFGYLKRLGARVAFYIPHRISDGYGFSPSALREIEAWRTRLLVTVDFGSTETQAPEMLRRIGADLIITDHHQLGPRRPDAVALVNPQQPGCPYPFKGLSAAGVAYKVVCALDRYLSELNFWEQRGICHTSPAYYLDLVALATVSDMSPLVGENRALVKLGLDAINTQPRPGLAGLIRECNVRGPVTASAISFKLAPKINALGRIGDPRLGVQLLLSRSYTEARRIARHMVELNRERQEIERAVYASACVQAEAMADRPALVLVGGDWHPGVLGSIAARVCIQTGKPTVVLTLSRQPQVLGSARGSDGFNVLSVLAACAPLLARFGGHPGAAGLALDPANLDDFTRRFAGAAEQAGANAKAQGPRPLEIETWIGADLLTPEFVEEISRLSPFGYCNPEPVLGVRGVALDNPTIFRERHLRFSVACPGGAHLEAFAWDHSEWAVNHASRYDIAFMPQLYGGSGASRAQVKVLDMIASD